jgi:hypothetical protein
MYIDFSSAILLKLRYILSLTSTLPTVKMLSLKLLITNLPRSWVQSRQDGRFQGL